MLNSKKFQLDFHNRPLTAEFSDLAEQANGSVIITYGQTSVMATAVMSSYTKEGLDHFPLMVDYEEKFYAAGRILGSRFMRREGKPSEEAILNGRMIDRTLRPLFDRRMRNEIQIIATALSVDEDNDPDVLAILAGSLALSTSDIPWDGPVGAVRMARVNGKFIINPTYKEKIEADLDLVICGKNGKINMIEGEAKELPEKIILEAAEVAIAEIEKLVDFQKKIIKEIGKTKNWPEIKETPDGMESLFEKNMKEKLEAALSQPKPKKEHYSILADLNKEWLDEAIEKFGAEYAGQADDIFEKAINFIIHKNVLEKELRPDGRKLDEIRPLETTIGVLPRAHGTGLFYRGMTHILSTVTLGSPADFLIIEGMEIREKRNFIHHYNFPPFSSGEIGKIGNPGRREIGHGALAERALAKVMPSKEQFPYTIRIVSETMSSNGSSSMGSVCASTLALMDAGVPIKAPVSGIAMGIMMSAQDEGDNYKVLTDIQGPEDHHGDTDFKAAGTEQGITAIQMDVKVEGLTIKMLDDILKQSKKARLQILKKILDTISEPKKQLSPYAPQIIVMQIKPERKGELIGPGGRTINKIIDASGVQIDIDENGKIFITGKNEESLKKAKGMIEEITYEPQPGEIHKGVVTRIFEFGAMVEIKPRHEGLVHISELAPFRVEKVTDIVKVGDVVPVKVINIDEMGRINLSLKQADPNYAKRKSANGNRSIGNRFSDDKRGNRGR